jgi:hypothetical protein
VAASWVVRAIAEHQRAARTKKTPRSKRAV